MSRDNERRSLLAKYDGSVNQSAQDHKVEVDDGAVTEIRYSKLATVVAITNTMVGSTVLSIPWAWSQAGLLLGFIFFVAVGLVSYYTCMLVIKHGEGYADLGDVCTRYLGKWSQSVCVFTSILVLVGASIAYHIYMSDALKSIVIGIGGFSGHTVSSSSWNSMYASFVVAGVLFPVCCSPRMTVLFKLNSFGMVFVAMLLTFMTYESANELHEQDNDVSPKLFQTSSFASFVGVISLAFFIHNCILSLLKNHPGPVTLKGQDTLFGFLCVSVCYMVPGLLVSSAFSNSDMKQNFLNMFGETDKVAFIARSCILFQLSSVFPLLLYIIRTQFYSFVFKDDQPSMLKIAAINLFVIGITTGFAAFYPNVGMVLSFTGAIAGFIYMYCLPIAVHLVKTRQEKGGIGITSWLFHGALIALGFSCIVLQFVQ
jgi:sodium-coupled neutral amino acid transporter 9